MPEWDNEFQKKGRQERDVRIGLRGKVRLVQLSRLGYPEGGMSIEVGFESWRGGWLGLRGRAEVGVSLITDCGTKERYIPGWRRDRNRIRREDKEVRRLTFDAWLLVRLLFYIA